MPTASEPRLLRSLRRLYEVLLRAYPPKFRDEYSREMALVFRSQAQHVMRTKGSVALLPFMLHIGWDWLRTALRERATSSSEGRDGMRGQQIHRISTRGLLVLSFTALITVLLTMLPTAWRGLMPEQDEGIGAHMFQLSIVALLPVGLVFLTTADWKQPLRCVRQLTLPATTVVLAFSMLIYFERFYFPAHGAPVPRAGLPLLL